MADEPVTTIPVVPAATPTPEVIPAAPAPAAPAATQPASASVTPTVTPQAPAPPVSPAEVKAAEERVKAAQAKMHEATTEASQLRAQLSTILNHPLLGPVAKTVTQTPPQPQPGDGIEEAWKEYQNAPDDKAAFAKLLEAAEKRTFARIKRDSEAAAIQRANSTRAKQRDMLIAQHINEAVTKTAPDVPLDLFWAMSEKAEAETPATMIGLPERIEWQVGRAVELARGLLQPRTEQAAANAATAAQVTQQAGVVMPSGTASPTATPTVPGKTKTFVDQIKEMQSRRVQ